MAAIPIIFVVFVLLGFFLRDAHPLGSAITVVALLVAALAHRLRTEGLVNLASRCQILRRPIYEFGRWPFLLLVVEWLSIAIAGHFLISDSKEFNAPYEQFREWVSCWFSCYKAAYFP